MMGTPSKDKIKAELSHCLEVSLGRLNHIWTEIGVGDAQRQDRSLTVLRHLRNLLEEIVQEEEAMQAQILQRIKNYRKELLKLCEELVLDKYEPQHNLSMLQLEKELRAKLESLHKEKKDRLRHMKKLKEQDRNLCDCLSVSPYYIPPGKVPTKEQLKAWEKHIASLKEKKETRYKEFLSVKKKIIDLLDEMERNPETDFERDIFCEDESFLLSTKNMEALNILHIELGKQNDNMKQSVTALWDCVHTLWDRLSMPPEERKAFSKGKEGYKHTVLQALQTEIKRCEQLKYENMQKFVEAVRRELSGWWKKCYYSLEQQEAFTAFKDDNFSEKLLELHDKEVEYLKEYYQRHQHLFDRVSKRQKLFDEMLEFENKASDPNRFFHDRGGKLLQEEKARKRLMKELPKVEDELKDYIIEWEKLNGRPFSVNGIRFADYIRKQWIDYKTNKNKEKEERIRARNKQTEEEMIYGSKPTTPAKRRFGTPTKTPNSKFRKLNETKTPQSCSRIHHNTVFVSPCGRAPMSASKVSSTSRSQRRRSNRLARKVLTERNTGTGNDTIFSHTTVNSCDGSTAGNFSIASMGSYQDFSTGLNPTSRPFCRSSITPQNLRVLKK